MHPLTLQIISDETGLIDLSPEWDRLWDRVGEGASTFLGSRWHRCWWRHFGRGKRLQLMAWRRGGELVGLLPLMSRSAWLHGLPVRMLCFTENGNSLHNDLLARPEDREEVLAMALQELLNRRAGWEVVQLNNLPRASGSSQLLSRLAGGAGLPLLERPSLRSPYLELAGGWPALWGGLSGHARKTLRLVQNRIARAGSARVVEVADWAGYLAEREALREVARHSWTYRIGDSLAQPVQGAFFEDLARIASREGFPFLWLLRLDGVPIAFEFHLRGHATQHALRASYDERYAQLSPGAYLELEMLQRLSAQPTPPARLDLGGSFDRYKRRWTGNCREHLCLTLFHAGPYSRIAALHELGLVPVLRRARDLARSRGPLAKEVPS